ncbi:MAG: MerR family transcriptional regulator [Candidatus Omnitrophica bacterium]|nr:MerR family transcriptional regulator [Candidatus Omnitrophota bacterium]MDD5042301.1 MerR family transcriptional regulator [Candidatus Omnitrophota bacterium]MDD5501337.1 MerR family transcriptional regulator [Candidatus Omnitrophota bacterium]
MKREIKYGDIFEVRIDEPVYTSGVVCRLLHIPVWVLKQLDREEIISPRRKKGGSRLYSKCELDKLSHIWYIMREKRVKVTGLKYVLEMESRVYKRL